MGSWVVVRVRVRSLGVRWWMMVRVEFRGLSCKELGGSDRHVL